MEKRHPTRWFTNPLSPLLLVAPFFLWGTAMVAMKGTIEHTTPLFLATVRLLPAGVLVLLVAIGMGRPQPRTWKAWLWITAFSVVDGTLFQGFLAEGLVRTGAGLGSVMIDSQPLAVALMALVLFGERIWIWGWLGLLLGIMGISLLGFPDQWLLAAVQHWQPMLARQLQSWHLFPTPTTIPEFTLPPLNLHSLGLLFDNGQWLMLLAALSMAVGTVLSRYVSQHTDTVTATGWHMILGSLPLLISSHYFEDTQWANLISGDWLALTYATVFGSAIAYGLFFYFAAQGSLTSLSSLTFLTPVFALLFGNLILKEVLSPLQWMGVSFTLLSIYLINQRDLLQQRWQGVVKSSLHSSSAQASAVENNPGTTENQEVSASQVR